MTAGKATQLIPPDNETIPKHWPKSAAALWMLPALLTTVHLFFQVGGGGPAVFSAILLFQMLMWSFWALLTPIVFKWGRRFPLERGKLLVSTNFHQICGALLVTGYLFVYALLFSFSAPNSGDPDVLSRTFIAISPELFHWYYLIYWAILGAGHALDYQKLLRDREIKAAALERDLNEARLQALLYQLQPHFLFNSMNSIAVLVRRKRNQEAVDMLNGLSEILRYVLDQSETKQVPLGDELAFINNYLTIEKVRFGERLTVEMQTEPGHATVPVPSLILQPLVENAVRHGIAGQAKNGTIRLTTKMENDRLILTLSDNGKGLPKTGPREGIGLSNTRSRLERLYGQTQLLRIEQSTEGGVEVTLRLPPYPQDEDPIGQTK